MSLIALTAAFAMMQNASAAFDQAEQARLESCIERIETEPEEAYEDGLAWIHKGNRPSARQCVALALVALDREAEGASRLEQLANATDGGTLEQRAIYLTQAGHAWIQARNPEAAVVTFTNALKLMPGTSDLLIDRAGAYMLQSKWDLAITDLDAALLANPSSGPAYQMRAEAHLKSGNLERAMDDVKGAMAADPENIDTLVLRGDVREALRIEAESGKLTRTE